MNLLPAQNKPNVALVGQTHFARRVQEEAKPKQKTASLRKTKKSNWLQNLQETLSNALRRVWFVIKNFRTLLGEKPKAKAEPQKEAKVEVTKKSSISKSTPPSYGSNGDDYRSTSRNSSTSRSAPSSSSRTSSEPVDLIKNGVRELTQAKLGKAFSADDRLAGFILAEYNTYPFKSEVDLSNLNTKAGNLFLQDALMQIVDIKGLLGSNTAPTEAAGEILDGLKKKTPRLELLQHIHKSVLTTVRALATEENNIKLIEMAKSESNKNSKTWGLWQSVGEGLRRNAGHMVVYKAWPISMKELSDLHRNIEALTHLMEQARNPNEEIEKLAKGIKILSVRILQDQTLEKMSASPGRISRDDIPGNANEYNRIWKQLRKASGARPEDVVQALGF